MLRHLLITFRAFQRLIDLMFWPLINILLWGFNSIWNESFQQQPAHLTLALLTALLMWQILFRVNLEICFSALDEIASFNLCNLFSTPLCLYEWMIAVIGIGLLKAVFTFIFGISCIWLLFSVNILTIGWYLAPFIGLAILTGWSIGFLAASAIIYWGQSVREVVWVIAWIFVPFSGIFYSVQVLPPWAQVFSSLLPQSYLFESIRFYSIKGILPITSLYICLGLNIFYLIFSLVFFKWTFEKSRSNGLSRLENN